MALSSEHNDNGKRRIRRQELALRSVYLTQKNLVFRVLIGTRNWYFHCWKLYQKSFCFTEITTLWEFGTHWLPKKKGELFVCRENCMGIKELKFWVLIFNCFGWEFLFLLLRKFMLSNIKKMRSWWLHFKLFGFQENNKSECLMINHTKSKSWFWHYHCVGLHCSFWYALSLTLS